MMNEFKDEELNSLSGQTPDTINEFAKLNWNKRATIRTEFGTSEAFAAYCRAVASGAYTPRGSRRTVLR